MKTLTNRRFSYFIFDKTLKNKAIKRHCLACDLKDNPELIAKYEKYQRDLWPKILDSLRHSGITNMEIYRIANRLFMIVETTDDFSFEKKAKMDADNKRVQDWEVLTWDYQQALPWAKPGEKWLLDNISDFSA